MKRLVHRFGLVCLFVLPCASTAASDGELVECSADLLSAGTSFEGTSQQLEIPSSLPDEFDVVVRLDETTHVLRLVRHNLRAPGFRSYAYLADGRTIEVDPDRPATYRGWVVDQPLWPVVADLRPEGLNARILFDNGATWRIRTLPGEDRSSGGALHEIGAERGELTSRQLAEPSFELSDASASPRTEEASAASLYEGQHVAEIGLELHNEFYVANGSTIPGATAAAEAMLNEVDFFFAREALIRYTITAIIVRTEPYPVNSLSSLRDEWNTNQSHIPRDLVHLLMVGDPAGVASTGSVCNLFQAYAVSQGGAEVMGHELAHNWGAYHCHEYWPCNATCDSCLSLGLKTRDVVIALRDSLTCLDDGGAHPAPLPPFAHPDVIDLSRDEAAAGATRVFDVLANDLDGNMDPLSIDEFDPLSRHGGSLVLSAGTGAGGNDELVYTTPDALLPGDDHFHYAAGDGTGFESRGSARLRVAAPGLIGYWPLDGNGNDASGGERTGAVLGVGSAWVPGVYGQALQLDGDDLYVELPKLNRDLSAVTFTAWLRRDGDQADLAGVVTARGLNAEAGLNFGAANELRYHWNEDPAASDWDSGLVVPDGQWVFVVLAVEPHQATIYMHDGATLQSSANSIEHGMLDFHAEAHLGQYSEGPFRYYFSGALDDVRIYNYALGSAEIVALHDLGGKAFAPVPPDSGRMLPGNRELNWSAGIGALSHDVYFGADYAAVRDATPASPEFLGNTTSTEQMAPPPLFEGTTHAWRVDEVTAGGTVKGDVWLFAVESWFARWPLDELSGTTAGNVGGGLEGTYLGAPRLGSAGAQPELLHSVTLGGVPDSIELPALNLDRNEVTFTIWVKRTGIQAQDAGIFITRSGSTIAGMNVNSGGGLRYAWNDVGTVLGNVFFTAGGALPDNAWVLVGLVIAPDKTMVYLGQQGNLARANHFTHNGPQEFDGPLYLGQDPIGGRYFRGVLDDFRIYHHALNFAEMAALYAEGIDAGRVPEDPELPDTPLLLDKLAGGQVLLTWTQSCLEADTDYAVYEGEIGEFAGHLPSSCSTGGATSATVSPRPGDRYFLVVPASVNREGSYGFAGAGQARAASAAACFVQYVGDCP